MELKRKGEKYLSGVFDFSFFFLSVSKSFVTYSFQQDPNNFHSQKETEKVTI